MKLAALTATAFALLLATSASAADMAPRLYNKAAPLAPVGPVLYTWTGFYIGGHIGGAFRDNNNSPFGNSSNSARFLGGGQIGADYQFSGSFLVGVEGQYSYVDRNNNDPFVFAGGTFNDRLRGLASGTGRLGYTWGSGLIYAKGGYAYADTRTDGAGAFTFNRSRDGYTVGGGLEYMFAQNFSARAEYMYYEFRRGTLFTGTPLVAAANWRNEEHTFKVGLNYRFDLASPFAARY